MKHTVSIYYRNTINTITLNISDEIITFGRDIENDIVLDSPIISKFHGYFKFINNTLYIIDNNSKNGIFVNNNKIQSEQIKNQDIVKIDNPNSSLKDAILIIYLYSDMDSTPNWHSLYLGNFKNGITIGTGDDCDIQAYNSQMASKHAVINISEKSKSSTTPATISQLDKYYTSNYIASVQKQMPNTQIYVNSAAIAEKYTLHTNDVIDIYGFLLVLGNNTLHYISHSNSPKLKAVNIQKQVKHKKNIFTSSFKKIILNNLSFEISPSDFISIVGPSGCGKSTLIKAISRNLKIDSGSIFIDDYSIENDYSNLKDIIGYVPQNDNLHQNLTAKETLIFSAIISDKEKRNKHQIQQKAVEVLKDVNLIDVQDVLVKNLSGGQIKRLSIAIELISDPKILFLDEPTTGLDPEMEKSILLLLKKLSKTGKTIVFTTHSTLNLDMCSKIMFLTLGGKICYYDIPQNILDFFGVETINNIYYLINQKPDYWADKFKTTRICLPNTIEDMPETKSKPKSTPKDKAKIKHKSVSKAKRKIQKHKNLNILQTTALTKRYFKNILRDPLRLGALLLQAPLIAILISLIFYPSPFRTFEDAQKIIFVLSISGIWIGLLNSIQEFSKERFIFYREKTKNLKIMSYITSKFVVFFAMSLIQGILFTIVIGYFLNLPNNYLIFGVKLEIFITLFLSIFVPSTIGLFLSTLLTKNERALSIMPAVLTFQILFSDAIFALGIWSKYLSYISVSKWSNNALATIVNINDIPYKSPLMQKTLNPDYIYTQDNLIKIWLTIILFAIIIYFATYVSLVYKKRSV